jgi:hypothetical protein
MILICRNLIYHQMLRSRHLLQKLNFFQDSRVYVMNYYKRMGMVSICMSGI